jgi:hypothetical protein
MKNKWLEHLADERSKKKNKGKSLSEIMKEAKKTYKK